MAHHFNNYGWWAVPTLRDYVTRVEASPANSRRPKPSAHPARKKCPYAHFPRIEEDVPPFVRYYSLRDWLRRFFGNSESRRGAGRPARNKLHYSRTPRPSRTRGRATPAPSEAKRAAPSEAKCAPTPNEAKRAGAERSQVRSAPSEAKRAGAERSQFAPVRDWPSRTGHGAERSQQGFEEDRAANGPESHRCAESNPFRAGAERSQTWCDPNGRDGVGDGKEDAGHAPQNPLVNSGKPRGDGPARRGYVLSPFRNDQRDGLILRLFEVSWTPEASPQALLTTLQNGVEHLAPADRVGTA